MPGSYGCNLTLTVFHTLQHADRLGFRALKNALTELGEAVKALPAAVLQRHPEVDWKWFAGLRDLVTHQYFSLGTRRLLPIIQDEVPSLLAAVETKLTLDNPGEAPSRPS